MGQRWRSFRRSVRQLSPTYRRVEKLESKVKKLERIVAGLAEMELGERQIASALDDVRADHLGRYEFAAGYLKPNMEVLDIACGVGYGTYILARAEPTAHVVGVDIAQQALDFAARHYKLDNNTFQQGDCLTVYLPREGFDLIVSFETIEHIDGDHIFFRRIFETLRAGGIFICSTPNQTVTPFSTEKFPYHHRHYTCREISSLLESNGFYIEKVFSQHSKHKKDVIEGSDGAFHIVVCRKK